MNCSKACYLFIIVLIFNLILWTEAYFLSVLENTLSSSVPFSQQSRCQFILTTVVWNFCYQCLWYVCLIHRLLYQSSGWHLSHWLTRSTHQRVMCMYPVTVSMCTHWLISLASDDVLASLSRGSLVTLFTVLVLVLRPVVLVLILHSGLAYMWLM